MIIFTSWTPHGHFVTTSSLSGATDDAGVEARVLQRDDPISIESTIR